MKHMIKISYIREYLYILIETIFLFQIFFQRIFYGINFFDELITLILFLLFLYDVFVRKYLLLKEEVYVLCLLLLLLAVGWYSTYRASIQTDIKVILSDAFSTVKVFLMYFGAMSYTSKIKKKDIVNKRLTTIIRITILFAFICALLNYWLKIPMGGDDNRYGLRSFSFIFGGAGLMSIMCYSYLIILTTDLKIQNSYKYLKYIFLILLIFIWLATLRSRAFIYIFIYLLLSFIYRKYKMIKIKKKFIFLLVPIITLMILFICNNQIIKYFMNPRTARYNLLYYGIQTMNNYFPFGSGYGTYGTSAAVKNYSILYKQYNFNGIYGLSEKFSDFATDNYWPAIMGEFGVFGLIIMFILLLNFYRAIFKRSSNNNSSRWAVIIFSYTTLIASIATSVYFHFTTVGLIFLLALYLEPFNKKKF